MIPQWTEQKFDEDRIKISDDILAERIARVRPLLLRDGRLHFFDLPDLRCSAYTWEPKNVVVLSDHDWYVEVERGTTMHGCGYHAFFKPSIAEVLAQLPDNPNITAFYINPDSVAILDQGEGHICNVHWMTNISRNERTAK